MPERVLIPDETALAEKEWVWPAGVSVRIAASTKRGIDATAMSNAEAATCEVTIHGGALNWASPSQDPVWGRRDIAT